MKDYLKFFNASHRRTIRDADDLEFFDTFYDIFTGKSPQIARKFAHSDMQRQRAMLARSLEHMIAFAVDRRAPEKLRAVATSHDAEHLDIPRAMYEQWLDSLIETVRIYDPQFNDEVELAWRVTLCPGITYMHFKHDRS